MKEAGLAEFMYGASGWNGRADGIKPLQPGSPARGLARTCWTVDDSPVRGEDEPGSAERRWCRVLLADARPAGPLERLSDLVVALSEASVAGGGPRLGLGFFAVSYGFSPVVPPSYAACELGIYAAGRAVALPGPYAELPGLDGAEDDVLAASGELFDAIGAGCRCGDVMRFPREWCPDEAGWWLVQCPPSAEPGVVRLEAAAGRGLRSEYAEGELGWIHSWKEE